MRTPRRRHRPARESGERGATAVEYGLVLAALVLGSIPVLNGIEASEEKEYEYVSTKIGQTYYDEVPAPPAPESGGGDAFVATLLPGDDLTAIGDLGADGSFFAAFEVGPIVLTEDLILGATVVPAGSNVCTQLLHHSPTSGLSFVSDALQFPGPVYGWQSSAADLDGSDESFGVPDAIYPTGEPDRGIEPNPPDLYDSVTQTAPDTIEVYFGTNVSQLDQVRIFWDCSGVV